MTLLLLRVALQLSRLMQPKTVKKRCGTLRVHEIEITVWPQNIHQHFHLSLFGHRSHLEDVRAPLATDNTRHSTQTKDWYRTQQTRWRGGVGGGGGGCTHVSRQAIIWFNVSFSSFRLRNHYPWLHPLYRQPSQLDNTEQIWADYSWQ